MLTAVTCVLVIAAACATTSARQSGADQQVSSQARQAYQQWEHAAVHTSRNLMNTALSPAGSMKCDKALCYLFEESVCQAPAGNTSVWLDAGACVNIKDLNLDWGIAAYKFAAPPAPGSLQFFNAEGCPSDKQHSIGAEGLAKMQAPCPECKGDQPVSGWNFGSFDPSDAGALLQANLPVSFFKDIKSIYYYCADPKSSS